MEDDHKKNGRQTKTKKMEDDQNKKCNTTLTTTKMEDDIKKNQKNQP
jgi:hypothetical protein